MNNNGLIPQLVMPKLGSLEVYTLVPSAGPYSNTLTNFYWKDDRHRNGYGPFQTLYGCMEHYRDIVNKVPTLASPANNNVIQVDFTLKRRL